ncbi:ribonuclease H family protein [Bifidobacterium avesanii]|uniref:ribonuclease H n=1 Tax=Bifidobacterium avesanii TaxID=1798157 RepID=A0A7K3TJ97_9BIFI|nr:ribonuclease H [Bifidobacterium avesanii]KAB8288921.1 Ribonuclease HI [Bifidobacterium avesanii]NEG79198.1 ribonuclease HI [Bifidobacterium avesanii]
MTIVVSTDGSALGNPNGPMGWAWADHAQHAGDGGEPGHEHDAHGYDAGGATNGTNQIGELCAVLQALRTHPGPQPLTIETDSQYAINCSTKWVRGWKKNGWKNAQKKPVKNAELIRAIDAEISRRPGPVKFVWVKGHAGNAGNELVDELARTYAGDCRSGARDGYLPIEGWRSLIASEYARGLDVPPDVQLVLDGKADPRTLAKPDDAIAAHDMTPARRSVADLLTEPEGVPDIVPAANHATETHGRTENAKDADATHGATHDDMDGSADGGTSAFRNQAVIPQTGTGRTAAAAQPAQPVQPAQPAATGLTASGTIRITPPPSNSPRWAGKDLRVTGTITIDAPIAADGTIDLAAAAFRLTSVRER